MGTPSIYVYDCNNAGIIVDSFKNFAEQHEREYAEQIRNKLIAGMFNCNLIISCFIVFVYINKNSYDLYLKVRVTEQFLVVF